MNPSDSPASLEDRVRAFMEKIQSTRQGKAEFNYLSHIFQFDLVGAEPFYIEIGNGNAKVVHGTTPLQDPVNVTKVRTNKAELTDVLTGQLKPYQAYLNFRWIVEGRNAKFVIHSWIYRIFRIGQELR